MRETGTLIGGEFYELSRQAYVNFELRGFVDRGTKDDNGRVQTQGRRVVPANQEQIGQCVCRLILRI